MVTASARALPNERDSTSGTNGARVLGMGRDDLKRAKREYWAAARERAWTEVRKELSWGSAMKFAGVLAAILVPWAMWGVAEGTGSPPDWAPIAALAASAVIAAVAVAWKLAALAPVITYEAERVHKESMVSQTNSLSGEIREREQKIRLLESALREKDHEIAELRRPPVIPRDSSAFYQHGEKVALVLGEHTIDRSRSTVYFKLVEYNMKVFDVTAPFEFAEWTLQREAARELHNEFGARISDNKYSGPFSATLKMKRQTS